MTQNIVSIVNILVSTVLLVLFLVLFFLNTPERKEWRVFRHATHLIAVACLVLSASYLYSYFHTDGGLIEDAILQSIIILSVGSYQALLFTVTSIMLVSDTSSIRLRAVYHVLSITILSVISITAYTILHVWYVPVLVLDGLAYLSYIICLTAYYKRKFRKSVQRIENVYDDDMQLRLRWVHTFFYGALAVGLMALLAAIVPDHKLRLLFDISVPIYYTYVAIRLVNYVTTSSFVVKTFTMETTPDIPPVETGTNDIASEVNSEVERAVETWVTARRYAVADATVEEIVAELNVSKMDFNAYFKNVLNTQFRTWRRELRIREAMRMIDEKHSVTITELMSAVGYNDRSNFYKDFRQITGVTLKEYRDKS